MSGLDEKGLLPCPFCGARFKMGQEPHDNHPVAGQFYIYHEYGEIGSAARNCPIDVNRHFDSAEQAIEAWNRRAATTPADVGELVERLRSLIAQIDPLMVGGRDAVLLGEAATALERVTRERDEARADWQQWRELYMGVKPTYDALQAAEAKLAEARKVIEPFAEVASEWDGEPESLHVFLEWNDDGGPVPSLPVAEFRAARRWLEETK